LKSAPTILVLVVCLQGSGAVAPPPAPAALRLDEAERFAATSRAYLARYFAANPVRASELGIHLHDAALADLSRRGIDARASELHHWLERLLDIDGRALAPDAAFDHRILEYAIRAELLELEEVRTWRRSPMLYEREIAQGLVTLIARNTAPLGPRADALAARLAATAGILAAARDNLRDVPLEWAEGGAGSARSIASWLRTEAPRELARQGSARLDAERWGRLEAARAGAIRRLERFADWVEQDLVPRAHGDFRLGRELFERKLLYEEHLAYSVDELLRINGEAIEHYRREIELVAARIDADRSVAEVVGRVIGEHPTPGELLDAAGLYVEQARRLVHERDLLTLPAEPLPEIRVMPALLGGTFASMSTPGPFEPRPFASFFNLAGVKASWSRAEESEHLSYFNHPSLLGIAVHEVMPGHFVQQMSRRRFASDVRKVFLPASVSEGWAHYAEEMMVDEGLGGGDPIVRLAQLRRALQRHARWQASLSLHAFDGSLEDATRAFRATAYFPDFTARREIQRGTFDPTYLSYALGRMLIFDLREEYRRAVLARGERFSLREFHDRFLALGLPLPLARRALLGDGRPAPELRAAGAREP
jgi:uncharacterized protein (DUF885 family)